MNDVTALMGKLKANVAYLQFADQMTEERTQWPVLNRAAQITPAQVAPAGPAAPVAAATAYAAPAPAPAVQIAAPVRASRPGSFLSRYAGAPAPGEGSRLLSDIFARLEQK